MTSSALRVLVAPDSFKGTATAAAVARDIALGWRTVRPDDDVRVLPMADGGEGSLDAFERADPGARRIPVVVTGPAGRDHPAQWLLMADGTGVVELARTSGLAASKGKRFPLDAGTLGFGQAIAAALDLGVQRLFLAIGGSASTDAGIGALTALGARFLDSTGLPIAPGNRGLASLVTADLTRLRSVPRDGALILSDVTNPLLGPLGAARVFGPQKGADPAMVEVLEGGLVRASTLLPVDPSTPGAGAAGGTGFGLLAWGASLRPGSEVVGEALGIVRLAATSDVVITGEGRFDAQSTSGKVAAYVAGVAAVAGARALLVAGRIDAPTRPLFAGAVSLVELAGSPARAMREPSRYLQRAGAALARDL